MKEKIKDFLYGVGLRILIVVALSLLIIGGAKLFEWIYPILERISWFTWGVVWLLVILSIVPRFRKFTGNGIIFGTYIGGAIFWFISFYVTYSLWGILGIIIGVLSFRLGVCFTAFLALLFSGQFLQAFSFIFTLLQIFFLRWLGFWIITKYKPKKGLISEKDSSSEKSIEYIAVPATKLLKKPLALGIVFLSIFLFIWGAGYLFVFLENPVIDMKIILGCLAITSGIGLLLQKFWAYRVAQAIMIINIMAAPLYFFSPEFRSGVGLVVIIILILICGLMLWYLSRKKIKEQFLKTIFADESEKQKLTF